ncbi:hypothetical protein UF33_10515, partial [Vibrio parahaemolyticus]
SPLCLYHFFFKLDAPHIIHKEVVGRRLKSCKKNRCPSPKIKRWRISIIWSAASTTVTCILFAQTNEKTAINGGFFISALLKII